MAADRGIGAAGKRRLVFMKPCVEGIAHAVQALEFEAVAAACELGNGRDRQCVVGSELRKDARTQGEQFARAGDVVQVGHRLAGEDRIAVQSALLRALDLGVPVGALHQAHGDAAVHSFSKRMNMIDHRLGTLLIGLHGKTETVPAIQR